MLRARTSGQLSRPLGFPSTSPRRGRIMIPKSYGKNQKDFDPVRYRENLIKEKKERKERSDDRKTILAGGIGLFVLAIGLTKGFPILEDLIYDADIGTFGAFDLFDIVAALMWSFALYYVSPLDLLLIFLGKIETERPSDWLIYQLGRLSGQRVDDVDYSAPVAIRAATWGICVLGGFGIAASLKLSLGDETWALASGVGALMAAGFYELGRPQRLSTEEAVTLESQWQDFKRWADVRCQPSGRAHQSEIINAFRKENRAYASAAVLDDDRILDMIRNWRGRGMERTGAGYLKSMSLRARIDPFTGEMTGSTAGPVKASTSPAAPVAEERTTKNAEETQQQQSLEATNVTSSAASSN